MRVINSNMDYFYEHRTLLYKKMESIIGGASGDAEFPAMYVLKDTADIVKNTELAFYKLPITNDDYAYLFFKKQGVTTGKSLNVFPMLLSLDDGEIKKIEDFWFENKRR